MSPRSYDEKDRDREVAASTSLNNGCQVSETQPAKQLLKTSPQNQHNCEYSTAQIKLKTS